MSIFDQHRSIRSREDFVIFVRALRKDFEENPGSWENGSLEDFLGALASWVEDMDGYYANQGLQKPQIPDWKIFGDMLMAARVYE